MFVVNLFGLNGKGKMMSIKMSDDNILYCLETLGSFEASDIEDDDFEVAVNDDQFAQMSIVRTAELGAELIAKQQEQIELLREQINQNLFHNKVNASSDIRQICGKLGIDEELILDCMAMYFNDEALAATDKEGV